MVKLKGKKALEPKGNFKHKYGIKVLKKKLRSKLLIGFPVKAWLNFFDFWSIYFRRKIFNFKMAKIPGPSTYISFII